MEGGGRRRRRRWKRESARWSGDFPAVVVDGVVVVVAVAVMFVGSGLLV